MFFLSFKYIRKTKYMKKKDEQNGNILWKFYKQYSFCWCRSKFRTKNVFIVKKIRLSGSYADYLEIFIQQNKKNLCNLCDCWDHKYPVSSRAKKLNDDKYHMIKFPFPILDSVYNFILIHFLLTYFNIRES